MFGIIDCNNFFVSCERVFRPQLRGRAVVVLSSNDGCAIARSNEAKALGIKMGDPFFKLRHLVQSGKLLVCSGNLTLYGDMSRRVMSIVRKSVPRAEQYSIDECFMELDGISNVYTFGQELAYKVERWTGIPVSIGVAPTKTLAKIASKFAKKYPGYKGCCVIDTEEKRIKALQLTSVADVWGIGRRSLPQLTERGARTAFDLTLWKEERVRRLLHLPGIHTWHELKGHPCLSLETPAKKKSMTSSRSFKQGIDDYDTLHSFVVDFSSNCAARLREERSAAHTVTVFIRTDPFRPDLPQYSNAATVRLDVASGDLRELAAASTRCLRTIFRKGYKYKKAGVVVTDIENGCVQTNLFDATDREKQTRLLEAIDRVHRKNGNDSLQVASQRSVSSAISQEFKTPCYTTKLEDVIIVR